MSRDQAALVIMSGAPGSGKSTWVAGRFGHRQVFSLDQLRRLVSGAELHMAATGPAVDMLATIVRWRMQHRMTTVIDSTNTRIEHRAPLIAAADEHHVPSLAVIVNTPLEVCQERNRARRRAPGRAPHPGANTVRVPDVAVARLYQEARNGPPSLGEVDAVLTIDQDGVPVHWLGTLPDPVLAEPWLADTATLRKGQPR